MTLTQPTQPRQLNQIPDESLTYQNMDVILSFLVQESEMFEELSQQPPAIKFKYVVNEYAKMLNIPVEESYANINAHSIKKLEYSY